MWRWGAGWGATNFASLRLFAAGALARHPSRLPISGKPTWPMTASGAAARQAAAGGLTLGISCSEFPRVPYHKRHEQPCDGRSQLATAPCEPGDEQQGAWRAMRSCGWTRASCMPSSGPSRTARSTQRTRRGHERTSPHRPAARALTRTRGTARTFPARGVFAGGGPAAARCRAR